MEKIEKLTGSKLTLGRLLWAIRQSEELSQIDFAHWLKITRQHLCDIEHGRKSVSPKLAATYAERLGYSKEQFIRLSLQDLIDRDGFSFKVELIPTLGKKLSTALHSHRVL